MGQEDALRLWLALERKNMSAKDDRKFRVWDETTHRYSTNVYITHVLTEDGKLVYQNDRIHIEDPIPGVQEDVDLVVTWDKDGWVGQGKHGKCSLWTALTHHKVRVVGTIHDKEV